MKRSRLALALVGVALAVGIGPASATGNLEDVSRGADSSNTNHAVALYSAGNIVIGATTCTTVSSTTSTWHGGTSKLDLLTIPSSTWAGCTGVGGAHTVTQTTPMRFHSTGTATAGATDLITGHVDGVSINIFLSASPAVCAYTVTGSASATFNEMTQRLTFVQTPSMPGLTVANATGCLGQIQSGNPAPLTGSFSMVFADDKINVS